MDLRSTLSSKWFTRLIFVVWIACAVSIYAIFKNMESIVHGQLYDFGLIFSPEWADSYRVLTWMVFVCLGVPVALSGIALASSFLIVEKTRQRERAVTQKVAPTRGAAKVEPQPNRPIAQPRPTTQTRPTQQPRQTQEPVREQARIADNGNCVGISCPECKKVFGRALVMLDFRSGSNRMVSVCPYCNNVLGYTSEEKDKDDSFYVGYPDKKITQ